MSTANNSRSRDSALQPYMADLHEARKLALMEIPMFSGPLDNVGNPTGGKWSKWEQGRDINESIAA